MDCLAAESSLPSRIASLVHAHFDGLPARSKPTVYPDGSREWIPMSGIVVVKEENTATEKLTCVAVTTGAKCLPASQVSKARGLVLHDWHAEVLALRSFNYWLLSECHSLLAQEQHARSSSPANTSGAASSPFIRWRKPTETPSAAQSETNPAWPPFELQPDIKIYMYCTCAPCGDASMELCMAAQDDPRPWEVVAPGPERTESPGPGPGAELLDGRGYFSRLGIVRRKPARADAEATLSKSCSDKLALRQVSSLLSYEAGLLVAPTRNAYIEGLILPEEEISPVGFERCFSATGRMKTLNRRFWPAPDDSVGQCGYRFHPFQVLSVPNDLIETIWPFRKPKPTSEATTPAQTPPKKNKPGNVSAVWVAAPSLPHPCPIASDNGAKSLPVLRGSRTGLYETIINGVKQGNRAASVTPRGASALSRAKLWGLLRDIVRSSCSGDCTLEVVDGANGLQAGSVPETAPSLQDTALCQLIAASTYEQFKKTPVALTPSVKARKDAIRAAKEALKGWIPNEGDERWGLDVLVDPKKRKR
ncbi:tRNA-specific adenosine deaminase [Aspergillus novofumigatus IBT 16806]|uniref:Putative tRNA-specific adenosine deaminase n=1 Tax=Aspergillus novofumigatus (strain IBT 16806) TaxID=1392255 RepID=A0A2I1CAP7_ASPN1|nr:putative tRNA-specific adenosine deaminase [Aspergillus novofumigatus IBT 16806]PKX94704.1 putative tRNA-specific adenosine deaminase [Aspergillus novofumigatus IBT 16806]